MPCWRSGWTTSEIASASLSRTRTIVRLVAAAPVIMAVGLGLGALVLDDDAPWPLIVVWAVGLFIAGSGVGVAWPHLSAWIMGAVDDPVEAGTAAAAINTVQLISWRVRRRPGRHRREHVHRWRRSRGPLAVHRFRGAGRVGFVASYRANARSLGSVEWMPSPPAS